MSENIQHKLYGLDHLRALAIIMVFLFHYFILSGGTPWWLPVAAQFGWTGVDLFFVLSGFLISSQLFALIKAGQRLSLKQFFIKRFFRIVPAYLFVVGLYFFFPFFREKESLPPLWKFLSFTQNLGLNLKDFGTFSHAWSLCAEEHFYIFFPLVLVLLQYAGLVKKYYWLLVGLFVLGFGLRLYSYNCLYLQFSGNEDNWMYWYKYIYYPTYNRLDGFIAGIAIAGIYQFLPSVWLKISKYGNWWLFFGFALLVGACFVCNDQMSFGASVFGFPLVALAYGFVVLGAVSPSCFLYKWNSGITTFIASMSYGLYLTHKGIIHVVHQLVKGVSVNDNFVLLLCIVTCLAGAYVLQLVVEKPFMRLRNRFLK